MRSEIAATGALIIEVGKDYVLVEATRQEKNAIEALGFSPSELRASDKMIMAFPAADSGYHDYAEMVADIQLYNFGFNIPGTATIQGVEVRLDARADSTSGAPKICAQLSWDGGASWTATKSTATLTTSESTYILGGPADNWGFAWTLSTLSDANFRVRVIDVASNTSRDFSLDWVAVRVTYQP